MAMDQAQAGLGNYAQIGSSGMGQLAGLNQMKGTAVDSVNASIESLTNRVVTLANMARRISDGLIGVEPPRPESAAVNGPRAVTQSTQEHIKDLEAAFERLSAQINRLG